LKSEGTKNISILVKDMPKISLVVCLYKERELLERLLHHAEGCYDDLVVVHDGLESDNSPTEHLRDVYIPSHHYPELAIDFSVPEAAFKVTNWWKTPEGMPLPGSTHKLVLEHGGRYYEGPRFWQQEPHWPYAWSKAKHNWILRLDADEFPSTDLKRWLIDFRSNSTTDSCGFCAIWPPWSGNRSITKNIPARRLFLFNRNHVSFFGMVEHGPSSDQPYEALPLELTHKPKRKSIGPGNLVFRKQAFVWRKVIAMSLLKSPTDLPRWRFSSSEWPSYWEQVRNAPILTAVARSTPSFPREFLSCARNGRDFLPSAAFGTVLHKLLVPIAYAYYSRWRRK